MNTKKSKKRKALTVLNALLAVILALMLGATALAHSLMNKMNRVDNPRPEQSAATVAVEGDQEASGQDPEILLGEEKEIVNILLIAVSNMVQQLYMVTDFGGLFAVLLPAVFSIIMSIGTVLMGIAFSIPVYENNFFNYT